MVKNKSNFIKKLDETSDRLEKVREVHRQSREILGMRSLRVKRPLKEEVLEMLDQLKGFNGKE